MFGILPRMHREAAGAFDFTVLAVSTIAAMALAAGPAHAADDASRSRATSAGDTAAWSRLGGGVACIEYHLPRAGHVHVRVYDSAGRQVAHPVNEWQRAGRHITMFAFGPAPNQVFRYRVKCGDRISTGKIETGP